MTSGVGWRVTRRMKANSAFVPKLCPLSRIARRMPSLLADRGFESRARRIVLARGLADGRTDDDLENLILRKSRRPRRGDVVVCDRRGPRGHFLDQRFKRLRKPDIFECRAPFTLRCGPRAVQDPFNQRLALLTYVGHSAALAAVSAVCPKDANNCPQSPVLS